MTALLAVMGVLAGPAASEDVAQANAEEAATRAVPQQERAKQPGKPAQPGKQAQSGKQGQPGLQLPTFPQKFNVRGSEPEFFGFAVTQPGPVVVNVQAQGAPIIVTLQSAGGQPIAQQGAGNVRLNYVVKPQDVQRNLFWNLHIRLAQPRPPQQGGHAAGTVNVQHPPVDQAAVRQAMNALSAQQKQQSAQEQQQIRAQAEAQLDQAFQQRNVQFQQSQQQRRAALFFRIQPQVDQLRNRAGKRQGVKSRGVEGAEEMEAHAQSVDTRAAPEMQRPMKPGQANDRPISFPQQFHVRGPEFDSYGFGVTQPGPIEVDVVAQGMPVEVTLQRLGSAPISEQGQGQVRLTYEVTPQDVQESALWAVRISLPEAGARARDGQASGTIMVQHPEADPAVIQAQSAALAGRERANRERFATEASAEGQAEFREFKARIEQQHLQRQAKERAQVQPMLEQMRRQQVSTIRSRGVGPVIDRLSRSEGQPKDQVIVHGSNFGAARGELVFQLAQNVWGTAVVDGWSDTLIVANVPDASGLLPFDGYVVVSAAQGQSNSLPFRFLPLPEVREIRSTRGDISIAQPGMVQTGQTSDRIYHDNTTFMQLGGSKGNDIFFPTSRLQNGWVVQDIKPRAAGCGTPFCTGVAVADSRIGTDVAYFNVRWWYDALANLQYWFHMWVVGPRGVPDGLLVAGPLQPIVPAGTPRENPTPAGETPSRPAPAETTVVQLDPRLDKAQRTPMAPSNPSYQPPASQPSAPDPTVVPLDPKSDKARLDGKSAATPSYEPPASQPAAPELTVVPVILTPVLATTGSGTSTPPAGSDSGTPPQQGNQNPAITSLSVGQGQPGDPVMITGNNFGAGTGEIHFVIGPGKDLKAPDGAIWSDNQIFTSVPIVDGVMGFNGQIYVKRATDQKMSNLVAFRFEPALELREMRATLDRLIQEPYDKGPYDTTPSQIRHARSGDFFGAKGNDELFRTGRLKNGWVVDDAFAIPSYVFGSAGAYVWDSRKGTDSPYLNVRWWVNGFSAIHYQFGVRIVGPKGMADGVVVP